MARAGSQEPARASIWAAGSTLAAQAQALGVVKRVEAHRRAAHLPEDVNLEAHALARQFRGHVAGREALVEAVAIGPGSDVTDSRTILHDGLVTDDLRIGVAELHDDEATTRAVLTLGERGGAPGELRLGEVDEAIEAGFARGVIGPEVLVEGAIAFLEAQRGQGPAAEVRKSELAPRLPQLIVKCREVVGSGPDLVAELARKSSAREDRRCRADRGLGDLKELEGLRRHIDAYQALQQLASTRAGDRYSVEARGRRAYEYVRRGLCLPEPTQMKLFGEAGTDDQEAVFGEARHRKIPDDAPGRIQHRRERQPSAPRDAAGENALEPGTRALTAHLIFAVVAGLVDADA